MKRSVKLRLVVAILALMAIAASARDHGSSQGCMARAKTQGEMDACAGKDADAAERKLNETYQLLLRKYSDRPEFVARLRESQRAWLKFRDAQLAMQFPLAAKQNPLEKYGSVFPMCYAESKAEITQQRVRELSTWLKGRKEMSAPAP